MNVGAKTSTGSPHWRARIRQRPRWNIPEHSRAFSSLLEPSRDRSDGEGSRGEDLAPDDFRDLQVRRERELQLVNLPHGGAKFQPREALKLIVRRQVDFCWKGRITCHAYGQPATFMVTGVPH